MNIFGFLKIRGMIKNDKNVSADRLLSFGFGKYCFYNKNRERRIHCVSLVVL